MMRITAVISLFPDLPEPELTTWVERGWVRPDHSGAEWVFEDIDIARVRLIHDLRHAMAIQDEAIPLVLSLLDQVYTLRGQIRAVARAVEAQPEPVRHAIRAALQG
jgi:chaperone modulatory protein CbpM